MNLSKNAEWIYDPVPEETSYPELGKLIKDVEKALGFKLFYWQKCYIMTEKYRQTGDTTAKVLRALLLQTDKPIDFRYAALTNAEGYFRSELLKTKKILDDAGVKTRDVLLPIEKKDEDKLPRKCEVLGLPATLRQWVESSSGDLYGIIEYANGLLSTAPRKNIDFVDE